MSSGNARLFAGVVLTVLAGAAYVCLAVFAKGTDLGDAKGFLIFLLGPATALFASPVIDQINRIERQTNGMLNAKFEAVHERLNDIDPNVNTTKPTDAQRRVRNTKKADDNG